MPTVNLPPSISPWDERVRGGLGPQFVGAGWSIGRPALRAPSRNSVSELPPGSMMSLAI